MQREKAERIFRAGLEAVDPERAVLSHVRRVGRELSVGERVYDLGRFRNVIITGAGKGTAPMAKALEEVLGEWLTGGLIVVKYGHGMALRKARVLEAGHPVPDEAGLRAASELLSLMEECDEDDLVLCAFSGGGSALLPAPCRGISFQDKQDTTRQLLASGASIDEINCVRKHLSRIKGGMLARSVHPARLVSLVLSDVVGDRLDVIASGPAAPDSSTFNDCFDILGRYGLLNVIPRSVLGVLKEGAEGIRAETPKPGDSLFERAQNLIVGNNRAALLASAQEARALGLSTLTLSSAIQGEAREVAKVLAAIAREACESGLPVSPPACILAGGETTVTIRGEGKGGRSQELALSAAIELDGWERITLLSAGTDGTDGPTDAAGAFADGLTCQEARRLGLSPMDYLRRNGSYSFFSSLSSLFKTGPTRTNVMDLICIIVE